MRTKGLDEVDEEMMPKLSDIEKHLLGKQELFKIRGKVMMTKFSCILIKTLNIPCSFQ